MSIDRRNHEIGDLFPTIVPRDATGKHGRDMLAKQARHMPALRRQCVVHRRRDDELNDRLLRPAPAACIAIGRVHIGEARRDDDAGRVVLGELPSRQGRKVRQFGERDVHPERAGAATPFGDLFDERRRQNGRIDEALVEQFRIDIGDDEFAAKDFAGLGHDAAGAAFFDEDFAHRTGCADVRHLSRRQPSPWPG